MGAFHAQSLHKSTQVIGKEFRGIGSFGLVGLARPPWIDRDAGIVLGVLGNLEGIASIIGGRVGDQDQRLPVSLLLVVDGNTVRFDFRYLIGSSLVVSVERLRGSKTWPLARALPGGHRSAAP